MNQIPFNKPFFTGNELANVRQAFANGHISGDGFFTKKCHQFFENRYGFKKALLTHSCTAALEMSAILANIKADDEVIVPSFTFPSTATAFVLRGAHIVFADSQKDHPNIDADKIEPLITSKTKALVVVHYAGTPCDMDKIMELAKKYHLIVIEDAAQAIDTQYKGMPLGQIGHLGTFSFHETKNISAGEGGMLVINDETFIKRAEIIREKGTNRSAFFRGEVDKYGWVDIGSSYLPSDIVAACLFAQFEKLDTIQKKRVEIWNTYYETLNPLADAGLFTLPPKKHTNNGHLFYLVCQSLEERSALITHLKKNQIHAVFHYQSLHSSPYYREKHGDRPLPHSDRYSHCLVRLPLFYELTLKQVEYITEKVKEFYTCGVQGAALHQESSQSV